MITNLSILHRSTNVWQHGDSRPASWPGPEASVYHSQLACLPVPWPFACHPRLRGPYISSLHVLLAYLLCWNILTMSPTSGGFQVTPDQRICLRSAHLSYGQSQGDFPIHGDSTFKDQPSPALRFPSQQGRAWVQAGGSTVEPLSQGRG